MYGRYAAKRPSREVLDRFFFLDDADRELAAKHRGDHNRLGFSVQLVTVRHVGRFLPDPLDVPGVVVGYVAEQIGVADPSCLKRYLERRATRFEHQAEIAATYGYASFASAREELAAGWMRWCGRAGTGRGRCSTRRWRGCGSGGCCCPGSRR